MADAVKSVAPDLMGAVQVQGQGVHESMGRDGTVKGGVEDAHLDGFRESRFGRFDSLQVGRVMQWGQIKVFPDDVFHRMRQSPWAD